MSDKPSETTSTTSTTSSEPENPFAAPAHNPFAAFATISTDNNNNIFNLGSSTTTNSESNEKTDDTNAEGGNDEAVSGADSTAHYEPVVKLEIIETSTGEENDEEVYKQSSLNKYIIFISTY